MSIELQLLNAHGDELGRLPMQTLRLAAAGVETAHPDLGDQMARTCNRITRALADEGMVPTLDPIDLRLAVSRALLAPGGDGARIPLPVRPLGEGPSDPAAEPGAGNFTPRGAEPVDGVPVDDAPDEWDDLFTLDSPDLGSDAAADREDLQ